MAYVPVPKDLTRVKTKFLFNLTKRQVFCFGLGALVGVPLFFLTKDSMGPSMAAVIMIAATGMARGSDIYAAELVLEYRAQYPDIHLICALPHPNFEEHWSPEWQQRYRKILMAADYVKVICPVFNMSSYQIRNEWMVDHSALVIAAYSGKAGGTRNTIEYANKCHVEVHMLYIHE